MRDDFTIAVINTLARRAGFLCSNPGCKRPTSGPERGGTGWVSIGVGAHITAASPGGPRYDGTLTPTQRSSQENGIWLCQVCAKLIDSDPAAYTVEMLHLWRDNAERAADIAMTERRHLPDTSEGACYEAERLMPALIREMRDDVHADETELIRLICLKPTPGVVAHSRDGMFEYNQQTHPHLYNAVDFLAQMNLVVQEDFDPSVPRFRLTPVFHRWLRETDSPPSEPRAGE